jgi:hypothetical protein
MAMKIGITAALVLIAILAYAASRPSHARIERTALLDAPADSLFALINDFRLWSRWSPYEQNDPGLRRTFSGAAAGPGAEYYWSGNGKAGTGRMTILESRPAERISIKLEFIKPFKSTNHGYFNISPTAEGTQVTWGMDCENPFLGKVFGIFVDVDKMVGKDFEAGLANLEEAARPGKPVAALSARD